MTKAMLHARRASLRRLAALGAIGMTGLLRAALAANPQSGMRRIKGSVTVDGQPAELGQEILPGQKVVTGPDSEAMFVIGKDAFLQRENSEFGIDSNAGLVVLRYITGKVLSVFGKGRKKLETPTAVIGIRGTACYIEAEEERTYFCLCYGSAVVQPKGMRTMRKHVKTKHHESPFTIGMGRAEPVMARAKVINHTDGELIMLEELVDRIPPFFGKGYQPY
ncbi:hypothetical protein EGT07_04305 [Herbaspirillum sp. HC18]|nr:hypothetical protein EGT07_04305 [Herbaspirillum sp. HC18]